MDSADVSGHLARLAKSVVGLQVSNRDRQAILGGVLGAIYCFRRAAYLEHVDRSGANLPTDYGQELQAVATELSHGGEISEHQWLGTLYFNSGLHRLHLSVERFEALQMRGARSSKSAKRPYRRVSDDPIKADVERQKHEPAGVLNGRLAGWPEVFEKFEALCRQLQENWRPE